MNLPSLLSLSPAATPSPASQIERLPICSDNKDDGGARNIDRVAADFWADFSSK